MREKEMEQGFKLVCCLLCVGECMCNRPSQGQDENESDNEGFVAVIYHML